MLRRELGWLEGGLRTRVGGRPIALTRIMLGAALFLVSLEQSLALSRIADGAFAYPFVPWAPRPSAGLAIGALIIGWIAATCLAIGLVPDIMAATGAGVCLLTLLWDQQLYSSHVTLLTIQLVLLACAQSDRRWGVSGRRYRDSIGVPWWPQFLMMTQVSVVYLFAGLSKVQPTFLSGRPLSEWMWLSLPPMAFVIVAWATVITEGFLAVALWLQSARRCAVAVGILLHVSIVTLLSGNNLWLVAFALTTMSTYPLFLSRPSTWVMRRAAGGHQSASGAA